MTQQALIVTVGSLTDVEERTRSPIAQARADETASEETPRRLTFESTDEPGRVFSPRAIDLIRTIAQEESEDMREAARLLDRDIREVSRNLDHLEEYSVIESEQDGRAKRAIVPYDDIWTDLGLHQARSQRRDERRAGESRL